MKTVLCHGCFDVLHAGHLAHFEGAKKYGDKLIVSLTSDRFVNKGPGRPYFTAGKRAAMLKALRIIDDVVISDEASAVPAIHRIKPDFYVKGADYRDFAQDVSGEILNEKAAVEQHGGQLVFTDEQTFSSSKIINNFFQPWTDEQRATIDAVNAVGGIDAIRKAIDEISKLHVVVLGETILDVYRFVRPEGISSKSPSISARFEREEVYQGGSLAIHNHLKDFCKSTYLVTHSAVPCKKIRYISGTQRIFEVTEIDDSMKDVGFYCDKILEVTKHADLVIIADFGHGLFEAEVIEALQDISTFVALNVQSNSSNFGFNVYTKHNRFDYLCLDTREARLAMHDRWQPSIDLAELTSRNISPRVLSMTLGPNGACMINGHGDHFCSPAFADNIVDATGAGDAYFAITSCLLKSGCDQTIIPFIGNVFAGLKTKIIGNKSSVTKAQLLKACEGILK